MTMRTEEVCDNHQQACDDRAWYSIKVDVENKFPQAEFHHLRLRVLGVHDLQCGIKRIKDDFELGLMT